MPAPGTNLPPDRAPTVKLETKRAQPVYDKPSWLDGKRTYIGLVISTAGLIGSRFRVDVPAEEINGILDLVNVHWDILAQFAGLVVAAWGRMKASQRFKEATK
jgi:hypothetical protein